MGEYYCDSKIEQSEGRNMGEMRKGINDERSGGHPKGYSFLNPRGTKTEIKPLSLGELGKNLYNSRPKSR